jgi:hypothetical protein
MKEIFMTKQILRNFGRSIGLVSTMLLAASSFGQEVKPVAKLHGARVASSTAQTAARDAQVSDSPMYTYTVVSYPGTLNTQGVGMNLGALNLDSDDKGDGDSSKIEVVGAWYFPDGTSQTGFRARISGTKAVTERYVQVNNPNAPTPQQAYSINDFGTIVGDYIDSSNVFHAYEKVGDEFKILDVPFAGATGTFSPAINNAGEIVGGWYDSAGNEHSFTLIGGTYTTFDYPGASSQFYYGINSPGDIVGSYTDKEGNSHGFLRRGRTYSSIDFPGAFATYAGGINDSGVIVGAYCPTSQCVSTLEGEAGFVLKNGVYTTFAIPGEFLTSLAGINNKGVVMGNYLDAAELVYTFVATP